MITVERNKAELKILFDFIISGSRSTPTTSILSKCVPKSQLGKIFSISQAISTLVWLAMGYASTQVSGNYWSDWARMISSALQSHSHWISWSLLRPVRLHRVYQSARYVGHILFHLEKWEEIWTPGPERRVPKGIKIFITAYYCKSKKKYNKFKSNRWITKCRYRPFWDDLSPLRLIVCIVVYK